MAEVARDGYDHGPGCDCQNCGDPALLSIFNMYLTVWIFAAMAIASDV